MAVGGKVRGRNGQQTNECGHAGERCLDMNLVSVSFYERHWSDDCSVWRKRHICNMQIHHGHDTIQADQQPRHNGGAWANIVRRVVITDARYLVFQT